MNIFKRRNQGYQPTQEPKDNTPPSGGNVAQKENRYKIPKMIKPKLTTLFHYDLEFKTVDGEIHRFTKMCYGDSETLIHKDLIEFYLIGEYYLQDDNEVKYPIQNVVSITPILTDTIYNVKIKYISSSLAIEKTWYQKSDIEIYEKS